MTVTLRLAFAGLRRRSRGQVLALVLVCAVAATAVVAGLAAQTSAADLADQAYEDANHPDLVLYGPPAALEEAGTDDAVAVAGTPVPVLSDLKTDVDDRPVDVELAGVDPEALSPVGAPRLVDGRWPTPGAVDEIVVERSIEATGITAIGDTLTVTGPTGSNDLTVVGTAIELSDCFWPNCDPLRIFGRPEALSALGGDGQADTSVAAYRLVDPEAAPEVGGRLLADPGLGLQGGNIWPDTRSDILIMGTVFSSLVGGFGAVLLIAAAFVVAGATTARMLARRRSLALLKATGVTPRQLFAATWLEHLLIGAVGVLVGWAFGLVLAPAFQAGLDGVLDGDAGGLDLSALVAAALLVGILLSLSVAFPAWQSSRRPVTEGLRDAAPSASGGRGLAALARRLGAGTSTQAGLRRTFSRRGRAVLAGGALAVAGVGALIAAGFLATFDDVDADPAVTGNPWDVAVEARTASRAEIEAALADTPEAGAWFTEREVSGTVDDVGYTVRLMGGDPDAAAYVIQEGSPLQTADEAIVGYGFLQETGYEVGDTMTVDVDDDEAEVRIVGWYSDTADSGKMVQLRDDAVTDPGGDARPTWRVVAADGVDPDQLADTLAVALGDTASVDALEVDGLSPARAAMVAMAALLALVALANLVAMTLAATRERARALGVLRTVGCTSAQLVGQSATGGAVLGLAAAAVALPIGWLANRALADTLTAGIGIGPGFGSSPSVLVAVGVVLGSAVLAAGAAALATLGLAGRSAAELVRYE